MRAIDRRQALQMMGGASLVALLAACDTSSFNLSPTASGPATPPRTFGTGPVRVAMLLPLSGDASLAQVGISMANAAQLAMEYAAQNPRIGSNITLTILDTGASAQGAAQQARAAVAAGAALILGPLRADQVQAAGAVTRGAGIPLIGFSNNSSVAAPGIYLLNVLPETEANRSLGYARDRNRRRFAALLPNSDFGRVQQAAYQEAIANLHLSSRGAFVFNVESDMQNLVGQVASLVSSGAIDALFLPDRATAPAIAGMMQQAGIARGRLMIIGSADWDTDPTILSTPYLQGAVYPAVDDNGYKALAPEYTARFGGNPHPLATIAYTAAILANAAPLANARYSPSQLTLPGGFSGRDGVFRFLADGRSQYALIMKQLTAGGAVRVDGPKL
ncbi:MAG: penicillin-binding protein activator [Devosia sp.]